MPTGAESPDVVTVSFVTNNQRVTYTIPMPSNFSLDLDRHDNYPLRGTLGFDATKRYDAPQWPDLYWTMNIALRTGPDQFSTRLDALPEEDDDAEQA